MGKPNPKIIAIVKNFKKKLSQKYSIQHILLFGSQARGDARKESDIDIIVVSKQFKGKEIAAAEDLYWQWHVRQRIGLPVDFLCYDQKTFTKLSKKITLVQQAIKEGIEI